MAPFQLGDDGDHPLEFFFCTHCRWGCRAGARFARGADGGIRPYTSLLWSGIYARAWTRRFASDVDDVGAVFEQALGLLYGLVALKEFAPVGEGIGSDVNDPHDQRALAEFQRAGAEAPWKHRSHAARF